MDLIAWSKHSMSDKKAADKLNGSHINFVVTKSNLKEWIYSRCAYQKTFRLILLLARKPYTNGLPKNILIFLIKYQKICTIVI